MSELDKKIDDCDAKIAKLEAQLADLKSFRRGLEHARALTTNAPFSVPIGTPRRATGRGMSPTWSRILAFIGPDGKTLDQIMEFSESNELGVQRNTARSQIHTMVNVTGLLERLGEGHVRLTPKGVEATASQKGEGSTASTVEPSDSSTPVLADPHPER